MNGDGARQSPEPEFYVSPGVPVTCLTFAHLSNKEIVGTKETSLRDSSSILQAYTQKWGTFTFTFFQNWSFKVHQNEYFWPKLSKIFILARTKKFDLSSHSFSKCKTTPGAFRGVFFIVPHSCFSYSKHPTSCWLRLINVSDHPINLYFWAPRVNK